MIQESPFTTQAENKLGVSMFQSSGKRQSENENAYNPSTASYSKEEANELNLSSQYVLSAAKMMDESIWNLAYSDEKSEQENKQESSLQEKYRGWYTLDLEMEH